MVKRRTSDDMGKYDVIFESENIFYVKLSYDLIEDYLKMVNDPNVAKMISKNIFVYTYEQEFEWVRKKLEEKDHIFSMVEKETGEFIGNIEIMSQNDGIGEIGISITSEKQDRHYGTEAMKRIIEYGYNELKLNGFELNVYKTNPRAIHCYENVGFVNVGSGKEDDDIHMMLKK